MAGSVTGSPERPRRRRCGARPSAVSSSSAPCASRSRKRPRKRARLETHLDRLAERCRARQPGLAHRGESRSSRQRCAQAWKCRAKASSIAAGCRRVRWPSLGERGGRKLGRRRRRGEIDPDAERPARPTLAARRSRIRAGCRRSCGRRAARRSAICRRARRAREPTRPSASPTASAATKPSCAALVEPDSRAAGPARHRDCPAATPMSRPRRPRPAVCSSAQTRRALRRRRRGRAAWPRHWCCRSSRSETSR